MDGHGLSTNAEPFISAVLDGFDSIRQELLGPRNPPQSRDEVTVPCCDTGAIPQLIEKNPATCGYLLGLLAGQQPEPGFHSPGRLGAACRPPPFPAAYPGVSKCRYGQARPAAASMMPLFVSNRATDISHIS